MAKKLMTLAFGAAALFALTLPFTVLSSAQDKALQQGDPTQRGQGQAQGQGFPPQGGFQGQGQGQGPGAAGPGGFQRGGQGGPGGPGGGFGGFGGGGTAMVEDSNFLYVLMGNRLIKVLKADLKVLGEASLGGGMPGGPGGPGGFGGPGGGGQGGRGGAGGGGQGGQGGQGGGGGTIPPR